MLWLQKYLDNNDVKYLPPWMCALQRDCLGEGESKIVTYHAKSPREKPRGLGFKRKNIAFLGVDREEDMDWDHEWEDVEHVNDLEEKLKWDKIQ